MKTPQTAQPKPTSHEEPQRVAVIHYWLVGMRGGEKVVEQILLLYPQAEIFTHVVDRERISQSILSHKIHETSIARLPFAKKHYQKYLGFMPRALEEIDLSGFDLVISSESGPTKGVIVPPGAVHVCYCHSPMRYLYDLYPEYRAHLGWLARIYFSHVAHRLRLWDTVSAQRIDRIVANSSFTAARVKRFWARNSDVLHPHADLETYNLGPPGMAQADGKPYYVAVSELVRYKRIDLAAEAFRGLDARLIVVGDGEERDAIAANAPDNVEFRGRVDDEELRDLYRGAEALIFPGQEDFGIVPVEAMACGTPVIAYGAGGALDSIKDGKTGLFFHEQSTEAIRSAIDRFEAKTFSRKAVSKHASGFSARAFRDGFKRIIDEELARKGLVKKDN